MPRMEQRSFLASASWSRTSRTTDRTRQQQCLASSLEVGVMIHVENKLLLINPLVQRQVLLTNTAALDRLIANDIFDVKSNINLPK